jgi:hypothetical protein
VEPDKAVTINEVGAWRDFWDRSKMLANELIDAVQ